jgi:FAD/FMN-containing dehydrogenase
LLLTRRQFLKILLGAAIIPFVPRFLAQAYTCRKRVIWLNDQHTRLNKTPVAKVFHSHSIAEIRHALSESHLCKTPLIAAGGFHSAGGQQLISKGFVLETKKLNRVLNFDTSKGLIEVEAGVQWPQLIQYLVDTQAGWTFQWGIRQKPTGTDRISIGGSLSSNIHGRGIHFSPMISDVEAFKLIDANGHLMTCSRQENPELFSLVIGGYGLFGIIDAVTLRLQQRKAIQRRVRLTTIESLASDFYLVQKQGADYGDFQFEIDPQAEGFLTHGIFAAYYPVSEQALDRNSQNKVLSEEDWASLVYLAHSDKKKAYEKYSQQYLASDGQVYWNDLSQLGPYKDGYHLRLDEKLKNTSATEGITELYVPANKLPQFIAQVAEDFRRNSVNMIYGTVRTIQRDSESFLPWARRDYLCVIFNLHIPHTPEGINQAKQTFQRLIDYAIALDGSYYLTYHRYARKDQVLACYPQFPEFLEFKKKYDPQEAFRSNWYNHYKTMFASV